MIRRPRFRRTARTTVPGAAPRSVSWRPGQPCVWNAPLNVEVPVMGVSAHRFVLAAYSPDLISAARAAGTWARDRLDQYPQFFGAQELVDGRAQLDEGLALIDSAVAIEQDYNANKSEFGFEVSVPRKRPRAFCPHDLDPVSPYDGQARWELFGLHPVPFDAQGQTRPMSVFFDPPVLRGWTSRCFHTPSAFDTSSSGTTIRLYPKGRPPGTWAPRAGTYFRRGVYIEEGEVFTERRGIQNRYRDHLTRGAELIRCVEAGVAFRVSAGLNRAQAEIGRRQSGLAMGPQPSGPARFQ